MYFSSFPFHSGSSDLLRILCSDHFSETMQKILPTMWMFFIILSSLSRFGSHRQIYTKGRLLNHRLSASNLYICLDAQYLCLQSITTLVKLHTRLRKHWKESQPQEKEWRFKSSNHQKLARGSRLPTFSMAVLWSLKFSPASLDWKTPHYFARAKLQDLRWRCGDRTLQLSNYLLVLTIARYPTLIKADTETIVNGQVYTVGSESQAKRLQQYESSAYTWCYCNAKLEDGSEIKDARVFIWSGISKSKELCEGTFDLEEYIVSTGYWGRLNVMVVRNGNASTLH